MLLTHTWHLLHQLYSLTVYIIERAKQVMHRNVFIVLKWDKINFIHKTKSVNYNGWSCTEQPIANFELQPANNAMHFNFHALQEYFLKREKMFKEQKQNSLQFLFYLREIEFLKGKQNFGRRLFCKNLKMYFDRSKCKTYWFRFHANFNGPMRIHSQLWMM